MSDFQRRLGGGEAPAWSLQVHNFPLIPRSECTYERSEKECVSRKNKVGQAQAFLLAYDSYPLAKACLDPPGLISAVTEIELYDRLDAAWERIRRKRPERPPMIDVMPHLTRYLSQNGKSLLREFENRLSAGRHNAVPFEMFLIEIIMRDRRYGEATP